MRGPFLNASIAVTCYGHCPSGAAAVRRGAEAGLRDGHGAEGWHCSSLTMVASLQGAEVLQRGVGGCGSRMARTAAFAPEVRWRCCRPGRGTILLSQSRTYWHWIDKVLCQGSAFVLTLALTSSGPGNTALTSIVLVEVT